MYKATNACSPAAKISSGEADSVSNTVACSWKCWFVLNFLREVPFPKFIGNAILSSMEGTTPAEFTFKRSRQAITLDTKTAVKLDGVAVHQLLFQRLTIAAKASDEIEDIFKYELCSYPPALLDSSLLLREPQKPVLANTIWDTLTQNSPVLTGEVQYVLDGGSLLQRIPWTRGTTYRDICTVYTEYVTKKYGEAIVVFDGYGESSTRIWYTKDELKVKLESMLPSPRI